LAGLGYRDAVIDGLGGGHATSAMVPLVERLVTQMPVVLASRVGVGEVLTHAYRYPGSEIELMALGTIRADALDGLKARLLLSLVPRCRALTRRHRCSLRVGPHDRPPMVPGPEPSARSR
jgi:L-asparaginase